MFGGKHTRECTPLHDKGRATFPGLEHPEGLEPRMLLDEKSSTTNDDEGGISDLLIRGLVNRLPSPDSTWSLDARAKWLRTAASIFGLVYRADVSERGEISIDLASEQVAAALRPRFSHGRLQGRARAPEIPAALSRHADRPAFRKSEPLHRLLRGGEGKVRAWNSPATTWGNFSPVAQPADEL